MGEATIERRPMRPRDWRIMQWIAQRLMAMKISPNTISVAGVIFCAAAGAAMAATGCVGSGGAARLLWLAGAVGVQLRGLCNLFDGMVAVGRGIASPVGELYNEVPDRVSDAAMLIGLGYAAGSSPVLGFAAALMAVFVAYVRAQGRVAGAPQDYRGPLAKPHRMFLVTFTCLFFALTPSAWQRPWWQVHGGWGAAQTALGIIIVGGLWTAVRRLRGSAAHLRGKDHA